VASLFGHHQPAKPKGLTQAQLAQKASFGFYYPKPMPGGYAYVNTANASLHGQAYFMLANGHKHLIVHEQAAPEGKLDLSSLKTPQSLQTEAGQAAIGTEAGLPAARLLAGATLISINTTGSVPAADLTSIINSFKSYK
jgi:hypothetical protein